MKHPTLILTDSGGAQEETPSLGVPVLIMRELLHDQKELKQRHRSSLAERRGISSVKRFDPWIIPLHMRRWRRPRGRSDR
ncbi:MAG TPA: UDP-N-acetylglucosamine 2-epimerase [Anaerolineales bacterium]|nr:UDP-N-acetylglucosamine 2-epimerase [Anaerolineales bacterium]